MLNARVNFRTSDQALQALYDSAEKKCLGNVRDFGKRRVLVEGGGYEKIWLETQPMGGEMYAKRELQVGLNNQLMFMDYQRSDGRIPGSIALENGQVVPQFNKFQGFCFAQPALDMYYLTGRDEAYLRKLQACLAAFDAYLWRTRDSNKDGCLESWCVTDTGEDGALRYGDAPFWWTEDTAPMGYQVVPIQSMDVMGYSYSARNVLSKISQILTDGHEAEWRSKAQAVRDKVTAYLWDEEKGACFDRDKHGRVIPTLCHNTLRLMYWGVITKPMADRFIKEHLLNPKEFWTPMPLPSVAVSDPLFRNEPKNCWSGQPEGLTYQRAIRALENYGHEPLVTVLGRKLIAALKTDPGVFTQQFDPFTMKPSRVAIPAQQSGQAQGAVIPQDAYGPTMLALMEYVSRMYGVHIQGETVCFGLLGGAQTSYEQKWGGHCYRIDSDGNRAVITIDGAPRYQAPCGIRLITSLTGELKAYRSIDPDLRSLSNADYDIIALP